MEATGDSTCQACGSTGLIGFYEAKRIPAQTCVLLDDRTAAENYPTGSLLLGFCTACGFIQNTRFDLSLVDYSQPTEESQAFSATFNQFAEALAAELVDRYQLAGKSVVEIGCGKGDFLRLMAEKGIGSGTGIDPGYLPNREYLGNAQLTFERSKYGGDDQDRTADLVLTRHLMEHVPNVGEFFGWLRSSTAATDGASLVTELPDVARVLKEGAFWDVYYEHCSYFTLGSLARTIRHSGMSVDFLKLGFQDQYLIAGSTPGQPGSSEPNEEPIGELALLVESFASTASQARRQWLSRIQAIKDGGGHVAIWGGGSKAIAFVTTLEIDSVAVVDINPHKQGKWLPGTSIEVSSPDVLVELNPDLVIVMNPIYETEIRSSLDDMGLTPSVVSV